jgi:hypothetical protein
MKSAMLSQSIQSVLETKRESQVARSATVIDSRQASGDAARARALARFAERERFASHQWQLAVRQGR